MKGKSSRKTYAYKEDNIKMDLRKRGLEDVDWIYLSEDRDQWRTLVNTVMKFLFL